MAVDLKWLEKILEVTGWKAAFLAAACAFTLYLNRHRLLPLEPLVIEGMSIVGILCAFLSLSSIASHLAQPSSYPRMKLRQWSRIRLEKHEVEKSIPFLSEKEREIISYLLEHNQSMFNNTMDCGYASTLVSKGLVVNAVLPGQAFTMFEVPFRVPDHVWAILVKHKAEFPYTESASGHPWRRPWMA